MSARSSLYVLATIVASQQPTIAAMSAGEKEGARCGPEKAPRDMSYFEKYD